MNFELLLLVCLGLVSVLCLWSNHDWYKRCQRLNDEWYSRLVNLAKKIYELEERLDDDGR
jgi:hypothetical protein